MKSIEVQLTKVQISCGSNRQNLCPWDPCMVSYFYLPTWMVDFYGKLICKYINHMDPLGYYKSSWSRNIWTKTGYRYISLVFFKLHLRTGISILRPLIVFIYHNNCEYKKHANAIQHMDPIDIYSKNNYFHSFKVDLFPSLFRKLLDSHMFLPSFDWYVSFSQFEHLHPRKITWIPKMAIFERRYMLKTFFF